LIGMFRRRAKSQSGDWRSRDISGPRADIKVGSGGKKLEAVAETCDT